MKAIFIAYNQAYYEDIVHVLETHGERGYTLWRDIMGRGSDTGEPHLGSHAWPTLNDAILAIVREDNLELVLSALKDLDSKSPELGLRAFCWDVTKSI